MRIAGRAVIAGLSLLIVIASGVAWAEFRSFSASIPHGAPVPALTAGETDPDGAAQNILLIGSDTRAGADPAELQALHAGHDLTTANADTMIVLHVPSDGGRPTLVSFPRDSWVTIPGYGIGKINSAYPDAYDAAKSAGRGEIAAQSAGIIETIKTIHQLTGLYIDHYAQVDLLGFYRISEAIGGVQVCLLAAQKDKYSGIDLPKGVSVISGRQALAFVRQRHGLPGGDLDRIKRQQYFLKATFQKVASAGTLLNPFKIRNLLKAVGPSLLTDPALDLFTLARQFESLAGGKINYSTIPNNGAKLIYPDGVETAIVQVNTAAIPAFVAALDGKSNSALAAAKPAAPSRVLVDVLNGAGIEHLAARNATALKSFGFRIDVVDSTSVTPTTAVEYPPGSEAQAKAVLADVPKAAAVQTSDVSRVTLVLGTDGKLVRGLTGAASTGAASTAATAKSAPASATTAAAGGLGCIN